MKFTYRFLIVVIVCISHQALAQDVFTPFYVVIGGFRSEGNAQKHCTYAQEQNLPAVYAYNDERQMFYVYVRATQTKDVAVDILDRLKSASVFKNAWVFNGQLSGGTLIVKKSQPPKREPVSEAPVTIEMPVEERPDATKSGAVPEPATVAEAPKPIGKPFVFKLVNGETGSAVTGLVRLQETEKAMQFRGFNGNEKVYVPAPNNKTGKWFVVCHVVGFRELKRPIVYEQAEEVEGASVGADQEVVIPLQLQRVRKGDYIDMDGVKFYNNTALFTPGSERELDELVAMMEENADYQIRLHGHTNGNQPRDIVSLGNGTDFFNPHGSNAKSHASAKTLSLLRAELVKAYLVSKGIDAKRVVTKAEGGSQMIFESGGTLAGLNDRVEVEIRKH